MLYLVLFDAEGTDDLVQEYDHEPTEREQQADQQATGYHFGGYYEAESPGAALVMAEEEFEPGGCVA